MRVEYLALIGLHTDVSKIHLATVHVLVCHIARYLHGLMRKSGKNRQGADAGDFRAAEHELSHAAIERPHRIGLGAK